MRVLFEICFRDSQDHHVLLEESVKKGKEGKCGKSEELPVIMVQYEEELLSRHSKGGQKAQGGGLDPTGRRRGGQSSRQQPGRMLLRPRPPPALLLPVPPAAAVLPLPRPVRWSKGLCVNVLWREAWWEGILLEDLSPEKARMGVYFPDERGQNVFIIKDLQLCEQWEEERAGWSLRVRGKLPFFLLKPYSSSSPSPSSQSRSLQRPNLWKQQEAVFGAKKLIFKPIKPKTPVKIVGGPVKKKVEEEEEDSSDDDEMPSSCARLQRVSRFSSCIPGRRRAVMMAPAQQPPTSPTTSSDTNTSSSSKLLQKFGYGCGQARNNTHLLPELLQQQQHKRMKVQEEQQSRRRESLRSGIKQQQHEEEERQMGSRTLHHIRNSYRVVKKHEEEVVLLAAAASEGEHVREEFVDMVIHHHQQRHHQTEKKSRGFDSVEAYSTLGSNSVGISMVLRRRQQQPRQSAQEEEEFDRFEPDVNVGMMEKNLLHKVTMHYRKRPSANRQHCSFVDTERQCSKKRRCGGGATEAAAGPPHAVVDVLMPQLTQDEAAAAVAGARGSKNHVAAVVHKGLLGVQEKIGKKKGGHGGCRMEVKLSAPVDSVHEGGSLTSMNAKKSILSWLMDLGMLAVNQKLRYVHRTRKQIALDGWVTPEGVLCSCCKTIVTLSMFEAHCGSKLHRPCANIYVEDGRTLTELQIEALKNQNPSDQLAVYSHPATTVCPGRSRSGATTKVKECAADGNDDTCGVCGDGGMLICCDHCPSTFHLSCMELQVRCFLSPFWRLLWHPHGVVIVLPLLLEIVVACTPYVVIADFCYFLFRLFQKRTGSVPTAGVQYVVGRQ